MIIEGKGSLLKTDAEALVNTVNCVGFMGKGIALQFKQAWPENYEVYARVCKAGGLQPGKMLVFETHRMMNPRYLINFPTKRHWRGDSRIEDIKSGLDALVAEVRDRRISSIAVPPLGCGNGGLNWHEVRPLIEAAFSTLPEVKVILFAPAGAPIADSMPVNTRRPRMTQARALLTKVMDVYASLNYRRTLLEVQKLAYFLQESGEVLRLRYEPGHFGPYAANLNKVLEILEGHFIRGYGDSQKPDAVIDLLPGATHEAEAFLIGNEDSLRRLNRITQLIEGFETPYGMELLSTVHWVVMHSEPKAQSADQVVRAVRGWNERKRTLMKEPHIRLAYDHLAAQGWLAAPTASSKTS